MVLGGQPRDPGSISGPRKIWGVQLKLMSPGPDLAINEEGREGQGGQKTNAIRNRESPPQSVGPNNRILQLTKSLR